MTDPLVKGSPPENQPQQQQQKMPQSNVRNKRNLFVDALAILFGISSWIGVNSSYLQVPLLVSTAPEGLSLASIMTVAVQSSNVISFAYIAYQKFSPWKMKDANLIIATMILGCATAIGMAFFYGNTTEINGTSHSVAYLIGVFLFAIVGTVSSVLFLPFMGRYRECYLISYMCGQGMNGLFSTFLALCQGIGDAGECVRNNSTVGPPWIKKVPSPNFGTQTFFLLVFAMLVVCTIAFILLNSLEVCKKGWYARFVVLQFQLSITFIFSINNVLYRINLEYAPGQVLISNEFYYNDEDRHDIATGRVPENVLNLSKFNYFKLLLALFLIGFFGNGIFPGLMSYSAYPYSAQAYHLAVTLANVGNSIGSIVAQFVSHCSFRILDAMISVVIVTGVYIFFIATQSPTPPFVHTTFGSVMIVLLWIVFIGVQSYMKTAIAAIFRYQEGKSLMLQAAISLSCSIVGSIVGLFVIQLFHNSMPC